MGREDRRPVLQPRCEMCWETFSTTAPNAKICPACRRPGSSGSKKKKR